jgi:plasmid stabilization system protein ParE
MGWKIIFAPQALEELEQIVRFVAQDNPEAAIRFGDYLVVSPNLGRHTGNG